MSSEDEAFDVRTIIHFLENLNEERKLKRDVLFRVDNCTIQLNNFATQNGLSPNDLYQLVGAMKSKFKVLGTKRIIKLLKCLVPAEVVPEEAAIRILGWISVGRLTKMLKVELFKWLLAIYLYDVAACKTTIQKLYDIVFCCLFDDDVCKYSAHLLYVLTRKNDVTTYHIKQLMRLNKRLGHKPYLIGLLNLYQVYRPEVVRISPKVKRLFRPPLQWKEIFENIRIRQKLTVGPYLRHCDSGVVTGLSVALEKEISSYEYLEDLLKKVDTEYTTRDIFHSTNRNIIFTNEKGSLLKLRCKHWLQVACYDICMDENKSQNSLFVVNKFAEFLQIWKSYQDFDGHVFLREYLNFWDGKSNVKLVFSLISTLDMEHFGTIWEEILKKLETLCFSGTVEFQYEYITSLHTLCENWIVHKLPRLMEEDVKSGVEAIRNLQIYIDKLCNDLLGQQKVPSSHILIFILEFHLRMLDFVLRKRISIVIEPSPAFIYSSFISFSPYVLSKLCSLLVKYKLVVQQLKITGDISPSVVMKINSYIVDVLNCFCKEKMYYVNEKSSVFNTDFLTNPVRDTVSNYNKCFTFYRHPAIILLVLEFVREKQYFNIDFEDLLRDSTLRNEFLSYFDRLIYKDILDFLRTYVKF